MPQPTDLVVLPPDRITRAKVGYAAHLVPATSLRCVLGGSDDAPRSGDLVLATVDSVGHVDRLELPDGRRATLFPGDELVVVYGSCRSTEQYEAGVPDGLGPCELVSATGVAGLARSNHAKVGAPTRLVPVGLLADAHGRRLNLADWRLALPDRRPGEVSPPTIAVVGAGARSGAGAAAGALVRGLATSGRRVGAAKVAGLGGGDLWQLADGGASPVFDVTHAGRPSTEGLGDDALDDVVRTLWSHLAHARVDAAVLLVPVSATGAGATAVLDGSDGFAAPDAVLFAAADALSAVSGVERLALRGTTTVAVVGALGDSPLACREARACLPDVPVLTVDDLASPLVAEQLLSRSR